MRKITIEAVEAFTSYGDYKKDNTEVHTYNDSITKMFLHSNLIAELDNKTKTLWISSAGWETNTTKERLNGILGYFDLGALRQIKGQWYIIDGDTKIEFNLDCKWDLNLREVIEGDIKVDYSMKNILGY